MDHQQLIKFLEIATEAAQKGGEVLEKYWGTQLDIQEKLFAGNLVTEADKESEKVILDLLKKTFPTHSILSEEAGLTDTKGSEFSWVVDPLDGTTNYTHQYPMVSISIALVHEDKPIVGVVYNPIHKELFQAAKGIKSTLNGHPIQVSKVTSLPQSLLATGFAYDRRETADNNYAEFCHMTHLSQGVRREGSAALDLAYVACGRLDGYWERGLNPWDIAAGVILIEEAGGKVSSYEGDPLILETGRILASNGLIHNELIQELQNVGDGKPQPYY
ncbi:MAG: Inositol-1-monophosphatase [Chlamydiae bacterium]|nr:Inositol-1-monophosphatase [Chlamydiota bacterium]